MNAKDVKKFKIKNCPFCGNKASMELYDGLTNGAEIKCSGCGVSIGTLIDWNYETAAENKMLELIERWNRRAGDKIAGWIPVEEKLPLDDEYKIVTVKSGKKALLQTNRAYYMNGLWHGPIGNGEVIAWAEIEPFQEV